MDKENKYYTLIENLVKKHKKFPGYEAILDDIIDDVYSHAEVIIKSIDNESVIEAYLTKTISTSIITVPRKLNYRKNSEAEVPAPQIIFPSIEKKNASPDLVEKMINSSFEERDDNTTSEQVIDTEDFINPSEEIKTVDDADISSLLVQPVEPEINIENNNTNSFVEQTEENFDIYDSGIQEADDSLNADEDDSSDLANYELEEEQSLAEYSDDVIEDDLNKTDEIIFSEEDNILPEHDNASDNTDIESLDLTDTNDTEDEINYNSEEYSQNNNDKYSDIESLELSEDYAEENDDKLINDNIESVDEISIDDSENPELDIINQDTNFNELSFDETQEEELAPDIDFGELSEFDNDEQIDELDETFLDDNIAEADELDNLQFIDSEEMQERNSQDGIAKRIMSLNDERPELNILKVFELKYKHNYSINRIVEELDSDSKTVLEALSELSALV